MKRGPSNHTPATHTNTSIFTGSKQRALVGYPPPRPTTRAYRQNHAPTAAEAIMEEHGGLGHVFDIIPQDRNYKYEDVYHGRFGENAVLAPGNQELKRHDHPTPLFSKVETLEAAKRKATGSFSKLCSTSDPSAVASLAAVATRDQQDVLRARVDVLNTLLKEPDSHICVKHRLLKSETGPKTLCAVTYNRFLRESVDSAKEVGEIQSPMAWFVPGAQKHVANLLDPRSAVPMGKSLAGLLYGLRKCTPAKYCTKKLLKSLVPQFPDTVRQVQDFQRPSTHGQPHPQPSAITSHHTRVYEAVAELRPSKKKPTAQPEKVTYRVIMGVLDLNVLEQWQNPSTNSLVRRSIIDTALHHTPSPGGELTNVHSLHVKITRGRESHVLTFRPFIGDEACTVSHLLYTQDASGGDDASSKGLLRLSEDPTEVKPMHGGSVHEIQSYVCLGAHRESRYNEAQLNYIHSRGFIESGKLGNGSPLPDPHSIHWDHGLPPAKATRISGKDCDVMASSYHVGDSIHTVISVICYPPFGTQFKVHPRKNKKEKEEARQKRLESLKKRGVVVVLPRRGRTVVGPKESAADAPQQETLGKKQRWTTAPDFAKGQFYFVDGAVFEPWMKDTRLYLIDVAGHGEDTREVMKQAMLIRDEMIRDCGYDGGAQSIWDPSMSFKMNLQNNMLVHPLSKKTVLEIWQSKWQEFVAKWIQDTWDKNFKQTSVQTGRAFWFSKNRGVFAEILRAQGVPAKICDAYEGWSRNRFVQAVQMGGVPMKFINDNALQALVPAQIIPRPAVNSQRNGPKASAAAALPEKKELTHLHARIQSLESRLNQTRKDGNVAVLMQEVLQRLRQSC
jgi:hypothetical protein